MKPAPVYSGSPLGCQALAGLNLRTGLITAISAQLDGETSDAPLILGLPQQLRARAKRPCLSVRDRQFCDLVQTHRFQEEGDHFLLRYHTKTKCYTDPARPPQSGVDGAQRPYREAWGWLGAESNKRRVCVRMITLTRPGVEDLILVADLLDDEQVPAQIQGRGLFADRRQH